MGDGHQNCVSKSIVPKTRLRKCVLARSQKYFSSFSFFPKNESHSVVTTRILT